MDAEKPMFNVESEDVVESEEIAETEEVDLSKYTVIDADNLDEDDVIESQKWVLMSFLSPEGIMNCNVRMFKFRGAYPTEEAAKAAADKLRKKDKYFKIWVCPQGKFCDFDPPEDLAEEVVASNPKQQQIIDAQRKARLDTGNELAGRYKQKIDRSDRSTKSRQEESKKSAAAEDLASKTRSKKEQKNVQQNVQKNVQQNSRLSRSEEAKMRLRKKLAKKQEKANSHRDDAQERFGGGQVTEEVTLEQKTDAVYKASEDLASKKQELEKTMANLEKIRKLMDA